MLVIHSGTLSFGGTTNFYGLVYAVNSGGLTGNVVSLGGNAQVSGAVVVDGGVLAARRAERALTTRTCSTS